MKVLLSWLRELAPFEGDPVALGDQMSDLGMAVESLDRVGEGLDGIVVARVAGLRSHPDADRIQLVDVDPGDGSTLQVCCGAFNMAVGDLVPLAPVGATLPDGMHIERRKMRGQWSEGMLCSNRELGLGDDHEGIAVLGTPAEIGAPLTEALDIEPDVLYDLEINPNRPDAMSVLGVARDLAARLGLPFAAPDPRPVTVGVHAGERASVAIADPELCGRFVARVLDGVRIGPSPAWLARRLTLLGMRPINNVVDVSNYVMLELGQPNHTYDLAKVAGGQLAARWARQGESITTLDGVERELLDSDGVIVDGEDTVIGIAGVMGGASTEISDTTSSVLLEMAWWDPMTIARSSRRLGLRSEASMRFERGTDPEIVELAALRFAELLGDAATLAPGTLDARGALPQRAPARVRTARVNTVLGTELERDRIREVLAPIGFESAEAGDDLDVTVPSWRYDSATEIDVIEEVARHIGYSTIAPRRPATATTGGLDERQQLRRRLRSTLVGAGLCEAMPSPLRDHRELVQVGAPSEAVAITNPLAAEESVLRTSLRPGLVAALAHNAAHRNEGVRLFEIGKVFLPPGPGEGPLPEEPEHLALALAGSEAPEAVALCDAVVAQVGIAGVDVVASEEPGLHPTRSAQVLVDGRAVGVVGEIDPAVLAEVGVEERVAWLELDLDRILTLPSGARAYRPVSRFPSSDIDLAFAVPEHVSARSVGRTIHEAGGELVARVELFDAYRGPGVPDGTRSLAYRVRLQAPDRTLTDAEVATTRAAAVDAVERTHQATLRG